MAMNNEIKKNRILSAVMSLGIVLIYLTCDRLCRDLFLWNCAYKMKTINTLLSIGMTGLLFVFFLYYIVRSKGKFSWGVILPFCILYLCFLFSTVLNTGTVRIGRWADSFFFALAPFIMVSLLCSTLDDRKRFVSAISWLFLVLVSLNLAFAIFPELYFVFSDWDQENFIAYHSILCFPLTIGVMFALLDDYFNAHRGKTIAYLALFFANEIVVHAGGALIGMAVIAVYFIPFIRKYFEKWDFTVFVGFIIILFIILMWGFDLFISFPPVRHLVADVLHKELNLSGRTGIWNGLLQNIYQKPLFGYGLSEGGTIYLDLGYNAKYHPEGVWVHAHNEFLQTLFEGGILSLVSALAMLGYTGIILRQCNNKRLTGIFNVTIFSLLIMLQNDQVAYYPWYVAGFACQCAAVICSKEQEHPFTQVLDNDIRKILNRQNSSSTL